MYEDITDLIDLKVDDILDVWFDIGMIYKLRNSRLSWDIVNQRNRSI